MKCTSKILSLSAGVMFALSSMTALALEPVGQWQQESVVITPGKFSTKITWYTVTGAMFITSNFNCVDKNTMKESHHVQGSSWNGKWDDEDFYFRFVYVGENDDNYSYSPYRHTLNTGELHNDRGIVFQDGPVFESVRPYTPIKAKAEQGEYGGWTYQLYQSFDLECNKMP